jgi:peroxiredoxin
MARKTERGAKQFFLSLAVRTAPFALLAAACAHAQAPAAFPLLKSCGEGSEPVANIGSSDPVKIRYSFATDSGTCYAVTATVEGQTVNGYLAGGTHSGNAAVHPAIVAFEQEIRTHALEIPAPPPPPAPAPPAAPKTAAPQTAASQSAASQPAGIAAPAVSKEATQDTPRPLSFAGFRAVDVTGHRVDFSTKRTPNIVIYFWSAADKRGVQKAGKMDHVYEEFHTRGVDVVGVASARNATQLLQVCRENEFVWSEIFDSGGIANRYHVDPAKPYLVLDQSRKVIAAVGSPLELEPILRPLTERRRVNQ